MSYKYIIVGLIFTRLISLQANPAYAKSKISDRKKQIMQKELLFLERQKNARPVVISEGSTLKDYIKIGLEHNPGLKATFYEWKAAFKKISQAFSLPDPQFTYTNYIEEVETRVGPQERAFSIKQKFPFPDKLWIRKSKAFKASEVAYYSFEKKTLDLIYEITDAYYEYAYLSKAILLTKENMKLLGNFESVAQARYRSGLTKNQDLLKVQVELGKLENELYSLEDLRNPLTARLNALLNLPENNALPWPNESLEDAAMDGKYQEVSALYDSLRKENPQLLALSKKIEKRKDMLKLAKREYFPDLTVGVTKIDTGEAFSPATLGSGKDPLMVMLSVNVPIWFWRLNAGVAEARASLQAAEKSRLDKENELLSKLALVHYKFRDSLRQSALYKDALIPKAVQTLNATKSGYEAGHVDFLSLIDAQRVLLSFQLAYYRYNANFYQRLSELKSLLGEDKYYE